MVNKGYKQTETHKNKVAEFHRGLKRSLETRKNIGLTVKLSRQINPVWNKGLTVETSNSVKKYTEKRKLLIKEKNPNWRGGVSKNNYPPEFNKKLRNKIKERDNYTCQKCNEIILKYISHKMNYLTIHHIDYNKENTNKNNLIALCNLCNNYVNSNRNYWKKYFKEKIKCKKEETE